MIPGNLSSSSSPVSSSSSQLAPSSLHNHYPCNYLVNGNNSIGRMQKDVYFLSNLRPSFLEIIDDEDEEDVFISFSSFTFRCPEVFDFFGILDRARSFSEYIGYCCHSITTCYCCCCCCNYYRCRCCNYYCCCCCCCFSCDSNRYKPFFFLPSPYRDLCT